MAFQTPLVSVSEASRKPFSSIAAGDLVTVKVYDPSTGEFDQVCGARVSRIGSRNVWVRIAGISNPLPYHVGDALVLNSEQVIDW